MTYTKEDLERAEITKIRNNYDIAQLIADVRREERERCLEAYEETPISEYDAEQMHDGVEYVCRVEWDHLYERLRGE